MNDYVLLNGEEAASYCGLHINNFKNRIKHGTGPHFVVPGKRNKFYRREDLDAWVATWRDTRQIATDAAITPARISMEEFIDQSGAICPSCRSSDVIHGGLHADGGDAHAMVCCSDCPATWIVYFKLVGFSDLT